MDATTAKRLDVFWEGRIVGSYDLLADGAEHFTYSEEYLSAPGAAPISHSLPLRPDPYGRRLLRPFFAGLLPEETQRKRIASFLCLAEDDDFSLLEAIGGSDSINSILAGHWRKFAEEIGVSATAPLTLQPSNPPTL